MEDISHSCRIWGTNQGYLTAVLIGVLTKVVRGW
jgi:hypothetical protein